MNTISKAICGGPTILPRTSTSLLKVCCTLHSVGLLSSCLSTKTVLLFHGRLNMHVHSEKVKNLVKNCATPSFSDPTLETIVTTDASSYGLGAVLQQHLAGVKTVALASRTLSETERTNSVCSQQCLSPDCAYRQTVLIAL